MNTLLWTLSLIGLWNAINMAARIYYKEYSTTYLWSIIVGCWAGVLLFK